ncbi:transposase [Pediococcus acidilactici]|uniref:IS91 family transposase n=1 Tax=Pediococcus acidilactici TaxID=1254 RepID=UPI00131211B9|nr:transposase [Pediococcus acidilactici]KAF0339189.1 IS91 family transposase [Pediococcus acidilactici]KAF0351306.1 IS91 family transposase [Pediococcus acidilactici]KAF0354919.1 IS91 family transposase [Pediococcus acidilactici]KAF0373376.1 IS91 family transposase [Pediococcus acidilactici]KAF0374343.1 IS91 family transposase [Pediococcus acidilactici]
MKKNILQTIFFDKHQNWAKFLKNHGRRIRPVVKKEVAKFCPTCAVGESQRWSDLVAHDIFAVNHRHVIFTIDEGLREIFLMDKYRSVLLKGLMDEAARVVLEALGKNRKVQCGVVAALHTFGSKLEFNPHVHMVVTMGGITPDGQWKTYDYLPYKRLRVYWQNAVLKLIRRTLSPWDKKRVQPRLQRAYKANAEGFYVNAPKRSLTHLKGLLKYISRYMKRGPIAMDRIVMYDGESVLFSYKDKRTNRKETHLMSVEAFIGALIRHIPDRHFKTIRRYGIYSRRIKTLMKQVMAVYQKAVRRRLVELKQVMRVKSWTEKTVEVFGYDPLKCSDCGEFFEFMGTSVAKNGRLKVQYAKDRQARHYMLEVNQNIAKEAYQTKYKQAEAAYDRCRFSWERQRRIYLSEMPQA